MTEQDALIWIDFMTNRIFGWDIVIAINPETGRADFRTRHSRAAGELMRDIQLNMPGFADLLDAVIAGRDVVAMWPDHMQATVRFRMDHKVPREINKPSSAAFREEKREHQGEDWPEWLWEHGKQATVADHPPFPERSDLYRAWQSDCASKLPVAEIVSRNRDRKAKAELPRSLRRSAP